MNFISRKFFKVQQLLYNMTFCLRTTLAIVILKGLYFLNIIFNAFAFFFYEEIIDLAGK